MNNKKIVVSLIVAVVVLIISSPLWLEQPSSTQFRLMTGSLNRGMLTSHLRNVTTACRFYARNGCLTAVKLDSNTNGNTTTAQYRTLYYKSYPFATFLNTLSAQHKAFGGPVDFSPAQLQYLESFTGYNFYRNISPTAVFVLLNLEEKLNPINLTKNPTFYDRLVLNANIILTSNKLTRLLNEEKRLGNVNYIFLGGERVETSQETEPESRTIVRYLFENVAKDYDDFLNLTHNYTPIGYQGAIGTIRRSYAANHTFYFGANAMTPLDYKGAVIEKE